MVTNTDVLCDVIKRQADLIQSSIIQNIATIKGLPSPITFTGGHPIPRQLQQPNIRNKTSVV